MNNLQFEEEFEGLELTEGSINFPIISKSSQAQKNKLPHFPPSSKMSINKEIVRAEEEKGEYPSTGLFLEPDLPLRSSLSGMSTSCDQANFMSVASITQEIKEDIENLKEKEVNKNIENEKEGYKKIYDKPTRNSLRKIGKSLVRGSELNMDIKRLIRMGIKKEMMRVPQKIDISMYRINSTKCLDKSKKVLILDLDNTLIYFNPTYNKYSTNTSMNGLNLEITECGDYSFYLRPMILPFLIHMSNIYTLIIFTAADKAYAKAILREIERLAGGKQLFELVYTRRHLKICLGGILIKSLIKGVDDKDILVLDDSFLHWFHSPHNYIPIQRFRGDYIDSWVQPLEHYLDYLSQVPDVRVVNKYCFRVYHQVLKLFANHH